MMISQLQVSKRKYGIVICYEAVLLYSSFRHSQKERERQRNGTGHPGSISLTNQIVLSSKPAQNFLQVVPFSGKILCCCCFCRSSVRNPHPSWPRSDNSLSPAGSSGKVKIQHSRVCHEKWWQFYLQGCLPHPCGVWRELLCGLKNKKKSFLGRKQFKIGKNNLIWLSN